MTELRRQVAEVCGAVVGRRREAEIALASLSARRNVLLEGPPGTGKSTLLRAVAAAIGSDLVFVEGNAELTPARLLGSHDPALVLERGYSAETFVDGPLVSALRGGALLYLEEINRIPEETLNVLVTAMAEREVHVPRLGRVSAEPGFVVVAAMNPFDAVGTARISAAVYDRTNRIAMPYQPAEDEAEIVRRALDEVGLLSPVALAEPAVALVRATRAHPEIRVGSSVRGAIDLTILAGELADLRDVPVDEPTTTLDAALAAVTGRIRLLEGGGRSAETIVEELWRAAFAPAPPKESEDREGKSPTPAVTASAVPTGV